MKTLEPIDAALTRLAAALDQLDAAARSCGEGDALRAKLEDELVQIRDDRSRLAVELDGALARSRLLESASEEVERRLNIAGASINAILTGAGKGES